MRKISYEQYLDKIWGGWVGKCAGGILGAPIEGFKCFHSIQFSEELFKTNYPNDDLDLQVLWLDLVKKKGPGLTKTIWDNTGSTMLNFHGMNMELPSGICRWELCRLFQENTITPTTTRVWGRLSGAKYGECCVPEVLNWQPITPKWMPASTTAVFR